MKIVYLNTLDGKLESEIIEYLGSKMEDTDVFCLQEVHGNMTAICHRIFGDYIQSSVGKVNGSIFTQAIFVKKQHKIISTGSIFPHEEGLGLGQYIEVLIGDKTYHIINIHGITNHFDNKLDTTNRILQSQGFINYLNQKEGIKIIGGDFNILRNERSIKMFEDFGYLDLISKYKIKTTRNKIAWDKHEIKMFDSDYVFVSEGSEIKNFYVEDNLISDHLPMVLEL